MICINDAIVTHHYLWEVIKLVDYEKLYKALFNEITYAIEDINNDNFGLARERLINIQQEAEEIYISAEG